MEIIVKSRPIFQKEKGPTKQRANIYITYFTSFIHSKINEKVTKSHREGLCYKVYEKFLKPLCLTLTACSFIGMDLSERTRNVWPAGGCKQSIYAFCRYVRLEVFSSLKIPLDSQASPNVGPCVSSQVKETVLCLRVFFNQVKGKYYLPLHSPSN